MRNGHTLDGVFLVVQSEDNLSRLIEVLNWGVPREETDPNKEHEVQEGPELECLAATCVLGVFAVPEAEVEPKLDQVRNVVGGVGGVYSYRHNGVKYPQRDSPPSLDWGILYPVGFHLPADALVKTSVSL